MEVSALKHSGRGGLYARSPLLRLQSDERLVTVIRRGNPAAFELLVSRYESRLLSFCRHLLRSREDAEDVLQEVMTAAYNAMLSDDRPINVRPWLYRIARNRCLNHLRKAQAVGVDSMDVHFSDNGASTADKVHDREEFRQLVGDIHGLPETQRTALVLREMDALSYEQIAEAMDTTVPSVKSLLVRARVSLAEASEARLLSCEEVREELGEAAEGLIKKPSPAVRRHVKSCARCERFEKEIRHSSKALAAALVPIGAIGVLRKLLLVHLLGHSAGSGAAGAAGATGSGAVASAAGATAGAAGAGAASVAGGASSAGLISAGVGAVATKAAAGLAAAALVTAGTVAVSRSHHHAHQPTGLQVLTTSVNAGVARSNAIAPRLAAPVRAVPAASTTQTGASAGRGPKPANKAHSSVAVAPAAKAASVTPPPTQAVTAVAPTTPTATAASVGPPTLGETITSTVTTPAATTPGTTAMPTTTATITPTSTTPASPTQTGSTPTSTTPTSTTPATTTTTPTTATTTTASTTPTETTSTPTTTTPATTTTTTSSPPTGGTGIVPSSTAETELITSSASASGT
jgi:RNA polymerase sigma factor (sigma-70 family)